MSDEAKFGGVIAFLLVLLVLIFCSYQIVNPGYRGVKVTAGKVSTEFLSEGLQFKLPFISTINEVDIRQQTRETLATCFSADLQQVNMKIKVLYRTPEGQVVQLYRAYQGDAFDSLVAPRVQEAIKEITAGSTADEIVKKRESIKQAALTAARTKVGALVYIDDVVIENIDLTKELEAAIEQKMVQEQLAGQSKFKQDKAKIDAETTIIEANASAESIKIQGEALKATPDLIQLKIVEKWDGRTPQVVGAGSGANILLPIEKK